MKLIYFLYLVSISTGLLACAHEKSNIKKEKVESAKTIDEKNIDEEINELKKRCSNNDKYCLRDVNEFLDILEDNKRLNEIIRICQDDVLGMYCRKGGEKGPQEATTGEKSYEYHNINESSFEFNGRIGVLLPLSGRYSPVGKRIKEIVDYILGSVKEIELFYEDTQGRAEIAVSAFDRLVREKGVSLVIGPPLIESARFIQARAELYGVFTITALSSSSFSDTQNFVEINLLTTDGIEDLLKRIKRVNIKRFAVLYPESRTGREQAFKFINTVKRLGGEITGIISYAPDTMNFDRIAMRLVGQLPLNERNDYKKEKKRCKKDYRGQPYRIKKCIEKAKKLLEPIVDFDALYIPDRAYRIAMILPAIYATGVEFADCTHKDRRKRRYDGKIVQGVCLLGNQAWFSDILIDKANNYLRGALIYNLHHSKDKQLLEIQKIFNRRLSMYELAFFDIASFIKKRLISEKKAISELLYTGSYNGLFGSYIFDGRLKYKFVLTKVDSGGFEDLKSAEKEGEGAENEPKAP